MLVIAKRNLKIFFRDKSAVFFSFLSVIIILGLYVIFLGDLITSGLQGVAEVDFLINSWVMAGILAVTSVTSTLGAFSIMVEDRSRKIMKDFKVAPIKRRDIAAGYILGAFIIGVIMSVTTLILAELFIVLTGGELLPLTSLLKVLAIIPLAVLASSSIVFFITSFLSSQSAFTTVSTIIGTLIGFLTGIYIPIGSLPEAVQFIIKVFPVSHAGSLLREVMLERPMELSFAGAPASVVEDFKVSMGVNYQFGSFSTTAGTSVAILLATTAVFYALAVVMMARRP
ncbi:ABC transporter permease [Paenibacillaceae bacterium]|nr:ABC transporter permease [Paenibacillaceae bacterium]